VNNPVDDFLAGQGVHVRPLRVAIGLLAEGWQRFDDLVRASAAPRRSVEELLDAVGEDLERDGHRIRLRRDTTGYTRFLVRDLPDTFAKPALENAEILSVIEGWIDEVPPPLPALDHVQATPETVLRRALWLDDQYDLGRARLLFLGDHDLTSLAVRELRPDARITLVDLDERVLEYLDRRSDGSITTLHADLRIGLPPGLAGEADLVFSDPPYTPDGMGLFASRAVQALDEPSKGRVLLAYGFSPRHPALGAQVQRELAALGLTFEAILPGFHRYFGAQAIGSAADLYVCQPTAQAKKAATKGKTGIYTHGPQSVESGSTAAGLLDRLRDIAGETGLPVENRAADWSTPITGNGAVTVDLTADPGPWLLRVLLAANAPRVAVLLPNAHPDLADAASQRALTGLLAAKYKLRLLRSTPDATHAVVVADAAPGEEPARSLLGKAHGKLGNVWREALVQASGGTLTKNEARAIIGQRAPGVSGYRLVDLPRHRLAAILVQ
jgi:hypothetical protein